MKRVAVLMSTYNGDKYIKEQIDSILSQKCDYKIDLIVRDDGSTDTTMIVLKEYELNKQLIVYSDKNLGAGYSFLKMLIDNPGYDFYLFSDQDDFWKSNKIQDGIDKIKDVQNYGLYCSNAKMCDSTLNPIGRNVHKSMKFFNSKRVFLGLACAQGCTMVLNAKLAKIIYSKKLPEDIVLHDSYITSLCFLLGGYFYADKADTIKYRMHSNNIGGLNTASQNNALQMIKIRIKYIFSKPKNSIVIQNKYIIEQYGNSLSHDEIALMTYIIRAKKSFLKRVKIALDLDLRDESFNLDISNRVKILLNNF